MQELRNEIRILVSDITKMYKYARISVPENFNEMSALELAQFYHNLRNMLP